LFNNDFFGWIASHPKFLEWSSLVDPTYGLDLKQTPKVDSSKCSGKVDVLVYHKPLVENHAELEAAWMLDRTLELIQIELEKGFQYRDIAILTRKNKQSKYLAIQLKERNIPVISSDSLLVHYANVVGFLIGFMRLKTDSRNAFCYKELIFQYADLCNEPVDWELVTADLRNNQDYYQEAKSYFTTLGFSFQDDESHLVAWVYGLVSSFNLTRHTEEIEYLFKLLDLINEFVLLKSDDFVEFLDFYDANKSTFSISSPEGGNAITITSIHRSKGLEYPVVICPFVSWTHQPRSEQVWLDLKPLDLETLSLTPEKSLNYIYGNVTAKALTKFDPLNKQRKEEFDAVFLDSLNMLYVAFTRPKQHLHILIAEPNEKAHALTKNAFKNSLGQIVLDYCLSNPAYFTETPNYIADSDSCDYYILQESPIFILKNSSNDGEHPLIMALQTTVQDAVDFRIQTKQDDLYTSAQSKREHGEIVHNVLAKIKDVDYYHQYRTRLVLNLPDETIQLLDKVMNHDQVQSFFKSDELLFTERDILCPDGEIIRPDRVIQQNESTIIVDFKTGKPQEKHHTQMEGYKLNLVQMGYKNVKAVLIYIENQQVEEV
jgi:ATP-dependent exoDNAse (exonuclease V) beta subunit